MGVGERGEKDDTYLSDPYDSPVVLIGSRAWQGVEWGDCLSCGHNDLAGHSPGTCPNAVLWRWGFF